MNTVYIIYSPFSVVFGCWEYNNKYNVLGQSGETLLSAKEQSECIQRAFCANARAFSMPLMNPQVRCIILPCIILRYSNALYLLHIFSIAKIIYNVISDWRRSNTIRETTQALFLLFPVLLPVANAGKNSIDRSMHA